MRTLLAQQYPHVLRGAVGRLGCRTASREGGKARLLQRGQTL